MCGGFENRNVEKQEDMEAHGDAEWVCDTIEVWRDASETPEAEELVDEWDEKGWLETLDDGAHLILTGGEPTLPHHQKAFEQLFDELQNRGIDPYVEVETNGSINPGVDFDKYVNHYNVSLKLSNSGMPEEYRINEEAIKYYIERNMFSKSGETAFKFVASSEDDMEEIKELIRRFGIPDDMVSLMPAGATQEDLRDTYPLVAEICKEEGWRFSPRLQVDIWNEAVGV